MSHRRSPYTSSLGRLRRKNPPPSETVTGLGVGPGTCDTTAPARRASMTNQLPRVHEIEHHAAERATSRPVVSGMQGVVAAGHPLVAMAGMRMLLSGGNAFDAAAAAGFAAAVVEPTASYTLCGECVAMIYDARRGERAVQPALAATLQRLVDADAKGDRLAGIAAARERFYRGDVAALIGAFSEQWDGLLRASDLAGYRARVEPPLATTFAGREILGQGAWTQGPILMQALGMLAALDLKALGHNSARYIHVVSESLKLAFADRERYYGDVPTVPLGELLAPAYLAERAALIRPDRAIPAPPPGTPRGVDAAVATADAADGTTHIAAIDAQGNMIALTPSGGVFRKSAFAPELGCTLSTRTEMFVLADGHPNALAPGKRPRTTLVSYLVCEHGTPVMTVGCPGGDDQAQANLQIILNLLVFGMNPQQAVEAPRFATQTLVNSFYPRVEKPGQLNVEAAIAESTRAELAALGHTVTEIGACGIGAVVTRRDPDTGVLCAAADPRRPTYALVW